MKPFLVRSWIVEDKVSGLVGVLDRAIRIHGALSMTDDTPLAIMWRFSRMLRLADGPDEVHKMVLARRELNRWSSAPRPKPKGTSSPDTRREWSR